MISLLPRILPRSEDERLTDFKRSLLQSEAEIGGQLFGPVPKGRKRQFFCLDENTWIWYEEWSEKGQSRAVTTRYDVRPTGVIKSQDGQNSQPLSDNEAVNLYKAAELYYRKVHEAYQRLLAS